MAINVPLNAQLQNATQLQQQIQNAVNSVQLNLGGAGGSRALNSLSQPLGRLTGQADEFTKSLDAANARVLAFGASVGVLNTLAGAFKALVASTINVEKTLTDINVVFGKSSAEIKNFGKELFSVAKDTGQSFEEVSKAALEFSRQGKTVEETLARTKDALILTRLTGLDTARAVEGLTATINSFSKEALTSSEIINKLAAVDQKFAVSAADLTEALSRSASVAQNAGVGFEELIGIVAALQEKTARGGAVIGNSLKTIFTRVRDSDTLKQLSDLGVAIQDVDTKKLLSASQILKNLSVNAKALGEVQQSDIFKDVGGGFQINQLIALLDDYSSAQSKAAEAQGVATGATNQAYVANEKLNQTIAALINNSVEGLKELGATLGDLGIADSIKSALGVVNGFIQQVQGLLEGDGPGAKFAQGIVKGIGSVLSGPGLALFGVVISKLIIDLGRFATQGLRTFLGVGKAASEQRALQEAIVITLSRNAALQAQIGRFQGNAVAQASVLAGIYNQQEASLRRQNAIAQGMTSVLFAQGMRAGPQGFTQTGRRAAGGYLPSAEAADVSRGVGGASPSSQVVSIPNFAFGNGQRGTMVANTSEYIVPNYANGGSAIFNQDMVRSMGLPAGAQKIRAAGGYIPNFAEAGQKKEQLQIDAKKDLGGIGMITIGGNPSGIGKASYPFDIVSSKAKAKDFPILAGTKYDQNEPVKVVNMVGSRALNALGNKGEEARQNDFSNLLFNAISPGIASVADEIFSKQLDSIKVGSVKLPTSGKLSPSVEGSIFQEIVSLAVDSFTKNTKDSKAFQGEDNRAFDYEINGPALPELGRLFFDGQPIYKADAKRTDGGDSRPSMVKKIFNDARVLGKLLSTRGDIKTEIGKKEMTFNRGTAFKAEKLTSDQLVKRVQDAEAAEMETSKRASKGYIPNFANKALTDSINRERIESGLPMSAISVTQDSRLMNSRNPTGLAVINSRDEPNGKIPNFANTPANNPPANDATAKGVGDLAAKFLILQTTLSFLQGGFTEAGSTSEKLAKGLQTLTMAFFAYQLIQGSATKAANQQAQAASTSTGLFKKAGDVLKKFTSDFQQGRLARGRVQPPIAPAAPARPPNPFVFGVNAPVPSAGAGAGAGAGPNLSLGYKLGGSIGSGFDSVIGVLGPLGRGLATAAIGLKAFNDIAALFYTRSSKLDSSLTLLASAASKAGSALNDLDKSTLIGVVSQSRNTGFGAMAARTLFSGFGMGKEAVSFKKGDKDVTANLKGGQTSEDFTKLREDLSSLILSDVRSKNPDADQKALKSVTLSKLTNIFSDATNDKLVLDLEKIFDLPEVKRLMDGASDTATKIQRITDQNESQKAFPKLVQSIENILSATSKTFNDEANRINNFSEQIKAIQSSKAFGQLDVESQFSTNIVAASKEFLDSFRKRQMDIIQSAQKAIKDNVPKIITNEDFDGQSLVDRLGKSTDINDVSNILKEFRDALKGIDPSKVELFSSTLTDFENQISTFNSNIATRTKTLALEQLELVNTTRAQIEFRNKFVEFSDSIGKASRALISLKGDLERIDIETESNINIRSLSSTSTQQDLDIKREETLRGLSRKQGVQSTIDIRGALIEARKQAFTQENLIALNSNTTAVQILTQAILQESNINFQQKYDETLKDFNALVGREMGDGHSSDDANKKVLDEYKTSGGLTYRQQLDYYKNALNLNNTTQNGLAGSIEASNVSAKANQLFAQDSKIIDIARSTENLPSSANKLQAYLDETVKEFGLNAQQVKLFQPELINIFNILKERGVVDADTLETVKKNFDAQQKFLDASKTYAQALSDNIKSLKTKLSTQPMTQGEYLTSQRQLGIAEREAGMSPEKLREYRSSFGRGFEESMTEVDARTLDFRNTLGKEIPKMFSSNLAQGLNDAISGAKSLKDALTDAATSFLNAITQKNIENIADTVTGGIGGIGRLFTQKANGGMANGGMINGGSGTKDDVPAMLMGGEYVVKKSAVKKYGSNFLDSLNQGKLSGYASGGAVQSGKGGFYTPGEYGQGAITGQRQLLEFATQSTTSGQFDQLGSYGMTGASINLEAESGRLTMAGRENSPIFERTQQAKEEAFQVYLNSLKVDQQYKDQLKQMEEAEKARKKQLTTAIVSAVVSSAISVGASAFGSGFSNAAGAAKAANPNIGTGAQIWAGVKGGFGSGGTTGTGGLGNLFSGNFSSTLTNYSKMAAASGTKPNYIFDNGQYKGTTVGGTTYLPSNKFSAGILNVGGSSRPINYPKSNNSGNGPNLPLPTSNNLGNGFNTLLPPLKKTYPDGQGPDGRYNPYPEPPKLKPKGSNSGGPIFGGSGVRDDVPAMLTGGEFVLNNRATRKLGMSNLQRLNSGDTSSQQESEKGSSDLMQALISKLDELISATSKSGGDNVVVNVSSNETQGEKNDGQKSAGEKELHKKIKAAVLEVITQEKRLGGSLSK